MPPCPQCHNEITKRKNDACPICGQAISLHQGHLYRLEDGAPNMAIIATFENLNGQTYTLNGGGTLTPMK